MCTHYNSLRWTSCHTLTHTHTRTHVSTRAHTPDPRQPRAGSTGNAQNNNLRFSIFSSLKIWRNFRLHIREFPCLEDRMNRKGRSHSRVPWPQAQRQSRGLSSESTPSSPHAQQPADPPAHRPTGPHAQQPADPPARTPTSLHYREHTALLTAPWFLGSTWA